jgi:DNA-binding NarL/FixJ family response regulator
VYALVSQPILAEGLIRLLEPCQDLQFGGWASESTEALREVTRLQPNVLMIDHAFGLRWAAELLERARQEAPAVLGVLWTKDPSPTDRRLAIEAGFRGILDKTHPVSMVLACLRAVAAGGGWPAGFGPGGRGTERVALRLTQRECEVIALIGAGLKNREIAERLTITPGTVKVHLMHIFEKTGARNRVELSIQAARLLESVRRDAAIRALAETPEPPATGTNPS